MNTRRQIALLCSLPTKRLHVQLSKQVDLNFFALKTTALLKTNDREVIRHQGASSDAAVGSHAHR